MATNAVRDYWHEMKVKAAKSIAARAGKAQSPETEEEAKRMLACAMRHGTYEEAADAIGEYAEWAAACLMLRSPKAEDSP